MFGAIAGGLGSLGGSIASAAMAAKEAKRNRKFQKMMSDTAHQREMKDLRKAGLNPILTATGGPGASTPGGSMAAVPDLGDAASAAISGAATGQQIKKEKQQIKNMITEEKLTKDRRGVAQEEANKLSTAAALDKQLTLKAAQETVTNAQQQRLLAMDTNIRALQMVGEAVEANIAGSTEGRRLRRAKKYSEIARDVIPGFGIMLPRIRANKNSAKETVTKKKTNRELQQELLQQQRGN